MRQPNLICVAVSERRGWKPPIILYHYAATRSGNTANEFLKGFRGYLMVDGYTGYNKVKERSRSKKVELLAKAYDHANHRYRFGFRMLTLGWSDGSTFLPVNSVPLSSENRKNKVNEATGVDKQTAGYKRGMLSMQKGTQAMLELLKTAKKTAIPAKYVLFDSWFSSPSTLHAVKSVGYDVIGMVKKTPKMFFRYHGEDMSLITIHNRNKKRRGRSR